jgi:hypothetical protein
LKRITIVGGLFCRFVRIELFCDIDFQAVSRTLVRTE